MVSDEVCDDGNTDGVGCLADCSGDAPGYTCLGGTPTTASVCTETCGDNVLTPSEQCEDQIVPLADFDGCTATCTLETGWTCNTVYGFPSDPFD